MIIVLLYSLVIGTASVIINPYGLTVVNDYTNCVNKIIEVNCNAPGLLYFINTENMSSSVQRIRSDILKTVHRDMNNLMVKIASPEDYDHPMCEISHQEDTKLPPSDRFEQITSLASYVLIIVDTFEEFSRTVARLLRARSWNPKAFFIILLFHFASSDRINKEYAESMVLCLFKWNVVNIVVIVPQVGDVRNVIVYSWKPLDPPKYCGYANETSKDRLSIENTCQRGLVKEAKKNLFINKIPNDMKGCVLQVIALERQPFVSKNLGDPNIETKFLSEVFSEYNLRPSYIILNKTRGEKTDEEWGGALIDIVKKKGQLLLGGIFPDDEVHRDFECSNTYLADSYTWVVPRAWRMPAFNALFIIFQPLVWTSVSVSFTIIVLSWVIIGRLSKDTPYHRALDHCFLNAFYSNLGFASYARPTKDSLRLFFIFFSLYCILFVTGYQTKLIDVLTSPPFDYQIGTVEELIASGLQFGGLEELHDLFMNSSEPLDALVGDRYLVVTDLAQAMLDVAVHRNFSLLCSRLELTHVAATLPELSDSSGALKYYAFADNVFTVPMEMVALQGFPFMHGFNHKIEELKQLGAVARVRTWFTTYTNIRRADLLHQLSEEVETAPALALTHLSGGFYALFLGYIIGTIVLFIEIFISSRFFEKKINRFSRRVKLLFHK